MIKPIQSSDCWGGGCRSPNWVLRRACLCREHIQPFPSASRSGLLILSRVGKLAVILSLTLFAIQPAVWAKAKTKVMECTIKNGEIVDKSGHPIGDCVLMKDGHMMMMTAGKMSPITTDITLADGTVCKMDGTCVLKSGKQIKLSNGEGIEVAGEKVFRVKGLSPPGSHFQ